MPDALFRRVLDSTAAALMPWGVATLIGICTHTFSPEIQSRVGSTLFVLLLAAYGSFTPSGRRAPLAGYFAGMFFAPILAVSVTILAASTQSDALEWLTLALAIGYHPRSAPDFDGMGFLITWSLVFGGLVFIAICLRQGILMWHEVRVRSRVQ